MVDPWRSLIEPGNYCKKPLMFFKNTIEMPLSRVVLALLLVVSMMGQSMVAFAAPCGGAGHDHAMMSTMDDPSSSHDHGAMHAQADATDETHEAASMDCCGKDPASCAMSAGLVLVLVSNDIDLALSTVIRQSTQLKKVATTSRVESLYKPPISA